ncbi:MAG: homoserine dehydrogenase [Polyangiales bacterium]
MAKAIGIGMIGCGVVGQGVLRLLRDNADSLAARTGVPIEVRAIAVRDVSIPRDPVVPKELLTEDAMSVVSDPNVQIVVELMGGVDHTGPIIEEALQRKKHIVTANKALIAERGEKLFALAEQNQVDLYFEAAVAGGIPIIRVLREGLASDTIHGIRSIVNGTSNYILSTMTSEGRNFHDVLRDAQRKGYAEADPALDVGGGDACHKLAILTTLAFGARDA